MCDPGERLSLVGSVGDGAGELFGPVTAFLRCPVVPKSVCLPF